MTQSDREYLGQFEIPDRLRWRCSVVRTAGDTPHVEVQVESPTAIDPRDLALLMDQGLDLAINPVAGFDLRDLGEALQAFKGLHMYLGPGVKQSVYRGWSALEMISSFERVKLFNPPRPLDLTHMTNLVSADLLGPNVFSAAQMAPNLSKLQLGGRKGLPPGFEVPARLKWLDLSVGPDVSGISFVKQVADLEHLDVFDAASFDCSSLGQASHLKWLRLIGCRELINVSALLQLEELEYVVLSGVESAPGFEALVDLRAIKVEVHANKLFGPLFNKKVDGNKWFFAPYRGPSATSSRYFEIHRSERGTPSEIVFDDWALLAANYPSVRVHDGIAGEAENIFRAALLASGLVHTSEVEFDSDSDAVRIRTTDPATEKQVIKILEASLGKERSTVVNRPK